MNTEIDARGRRLFTRIREFRHQFPNATWLEIDRYIEKQMNDIFADTLPLDQKIPLAAFGRACR